MLIKNLLGNSVLHSHNMTQVVASCSLRPQRVCAPHIV
jgi:hypothetical protein